MNSKNKTVKIISIFVLGAVAIFLLIAAYGIRKEKAEPAIPDRTYTNTKLKYEFSYPGDGRRIYETNRLGQTSVTVDAGVADKPGRYIHTVSSVTVVPVGDTRDNGIRTDAELEQRKAERPQDGYQKAVFDKAGVPGYCYYLGTQEIDKRLSCRYEYQGNAYYLSAGNPPNEEAFAYFKGTGQKSLLQVGEDIVRSFKFLP